MNYNQILLLTIIEGFVISLLLFVMNEILRVSHPKWAFFVITLSRLIGFISAAYFGYYFLRG